MRTAHVIRRDIIDELAWQPELAAAPIGVAVDSDGIVTLSGHVPGLLEKESAEAAVRRIDGVRAVANELMVRLADEAERDDTDIAAAAVRALQWNVSVPDEHITVIVDHGHVRLEGQVEWQYQRTAAERAVRVLRGVRSVENRIVLVPRGSTSSVARDVAAALQRNASLAGQRVKADVVNGRVVLRGTVRTLEERDAAEQLAWHARGVKDVENQLELRSVAAGEDVMEEMTP
jgi:osmotically-inducible protein OsmY